MKRNLLILIGMVFVLFISACSNEDKKEENSPEETETAVTEENNTTETSNDETEAPAESQDAENQAAVIDENLVGKWQNPGVLYEFTGDGKVIVTTDLGGGYEGTYEVIDGDLIIRTATNERLFEYELNGEHLYLTKENYNVDLYAVNSEEELQQWYANAEGFAEEEEPASSGAPDDLETVIASIANGAVSGSQEERMANLNKLSEVMEKFEPTEEQIKQFETYIIEEYKSGRYETNINNHEYMLSILFAANIVKEHHREERTDMFHFAHEFHGMCHSFYILIDSPGSNLAEFSKKKLDNKLADIEG